MIDEARLAESDAGLVPQGDGWFVVNVADAPWLRNDYLGARTSFEAGGRLVKELPELEQQSFPHVGVTVYVLPPGKPSTMYHAESDQESFLVLQGECLLIVEGQERQLRAWDFFYCAPHTRHSFVGAGDEPCVILMVGARTDDGTISLPARGGRARAQRRRRAGHAVAARGVRAVPALAARPSRRVGRAALVYEFLIAENRITVTACAPETSRL